MKLQELIIHNMASIEDATIDFEAQPLANCDVFLISGKTGAGKSTILDAICLALYGKTPRMENTDMQGEISEQNKDIKVNDVRQMMRRNTAEAFVSLKFMDNGGTHYKAEWSVARARKKIDGALQTRKWVLTNLDTAQSYEKVNEIEALINEAIQLDFNQFCRTTILPQGEFTRFLNSKDNEKAAILEKITGVDIYSRIGMKIYEVFNQKKQELQSAEQHVKDVEVLSPEELQQKNDELKVLAQKRQDLHNQVACLDSKIKWLETFADYSAQVNVAMSNFQKAKEDKENQSFKDQKQQVDDWNKTISARGFLKDMTDAQKKVQEQDSKLAELKDQFMTVLSGIRYQEDCIQQLKNEDAQLDAFLVQNVSKRAVYDQYQKIDTMLHNIGQDRQTLGQQKLKIAGLKKKLSGELMPAAQTAETEYNRLQQEYLKKKADLTAQEQKLAAEKLADKRNSYNDLLNQNQNLTTAIAACQTWTNAVSARENTREELKKQQQDLQNLMDKLPNVQKDKTTAEQEMERFKTLKDQQSNTIDKWAKNMRAHLHQGDECPVCRQKLVSNLPNESVLDALFKQAEEAFIKAEANFKQKESEYNQLTTRIDLTSQQYNEKKQQFDQDNAVTDALQKAQNACQKCGFVTITVSTEQDLTAKQLKLLTKLSELKKTIDEGEKLDETVKALRKKVDASFQQVETQKSTWETKKNAVLDINAELLAASKVVTQKNNDIDAVTQQVDNLLAGTSWKNDWHKELPGFRTELSGFYNDYKCKSERKENLAKEIEQCRSYHQEVINSKNGILKECSQWVSLVSNSSLMQEQLLQYANNIFADVKTANSVQKRAQQDFLVAETKLKSFLASNSGFAQSYLQELSNISEDQISNKVAQIKTIEEAFLIAQTTLGSAQSLKKTHEEKKPAFAETDSLETLKADMVTVKEQQEAVMTTQITIETQIHADEENHKKLGALIAAKEQAKLVCDNWEKLNLLIGDKEGTKFRKIALSYVLSSLIHSANAYLKSMNDRYTLKVEPGTYVISLEDAYQGFASRTASTISGGESFIVSLSLALALSDISEQLAVDTLFIDEGFGTLSGEPLQKAVDTLRSLHSKMGRHVGIISHVEELKTSIPVQIVVTQEGISSSSTVDVVPHE